MHAVEPQRFGVAPVEAAGKALARAGIGWSDVAAVELNEAFAVQSLACVDVWVAAGLGDPEIVNARGGAIAIGHPLGASGARVVGTLAHRLRESGDRWGVAAICIGVGQAPRRRAGEPGMTLVCDTADEAVAGVEDGATVLVGGFGMAGMPVHLIDALIRQGAIPSPVKARENTQAY